MSLWLHNLDLNVTADWTTAAVGIILNECREQYSCDWAASANSYEVNGRRKSRHLRTFGKVLENEIELLRIEWLGQKNVPETLLGIQWASKSSSWGLRLFSLVFLPQSIALSECTHYPSPFLVPIEQMGLTSSSYCNASQGNRHFFPSHFEK